MFFWNKICAPQFFLLFISPVSFSQSQIDFSLNKKIIYQNQVTFSNQATFKKDANGSAIIPQADKKSNVKVAPDLISLRYSFFCKNEWKIEKATKVPFRFRLGSLAQCDFYEKKRYPEQ